MAVPTKGLWAAAIASKYGAIIAETHPRVSLVRLKPRDPEWLQAVEYYKDNQYQKHPARIGKEGSPDLFRSLLWRSLTKELEMPKELMPYKLKDDHIDALVCALGAVALQNKVNGTSLGPKFLHDCYQKKWSNDSSLLNKSGHFVLLGDCSLCEHNQDAA
jgi:hypothetical protein